jgi:hypothetical protein
MHLKELGNSNSTTVEIIQNLNKVLLQTELMQAPSVLQATGA